MIRPEVVKAAKLAILAAAAKNPAITALSLSDEMMRSDAKGWLHLPAISAGLFSEWTCAMTAAAEELGQRQPCATSEAIANADAHLGNVGVPTYTELLAALRGCRGAYGNCGALFQQQAADAAAALLCKHDARMAEAAERHG